MRALRSAPASVPFLHSVLRMLRVSFPDPIFDVVLTQNTGHIPRDPLVNGSVQMLEFNEINLVPRDAFSKNVCKFRVPILRGAPRRIDK